MIRQVVGAIEVDAPAGKGAEVVVGDFRIQDIARAHAVVVDQQYADASLIRKIVVGNLQPA